MSQEDKIDHILKQVDKINRGIYGDPENKVPGIMQDLWETKDKVRKLELLDKKRVWTAAGFSAAGTLLFPTFWDWLKKIIV